MANSLASRMATEFLLDGGMPPLPNVVIPDQGPMPLVDVNAALASSTVTWQDLRWIREHWRGPMVVKGVLTGEDARRSIDEGAAAVVGVESWRAPARLCSCVIAGFARDSGRCERAD